MQHTGTAPAVEPDVAATSARGRLAGAGRPPIAWVSAIAVTGFVIRVAVLLRPFPVVERLFVPDDTYYTLTIARSLARGDGPSTGGHVLTSGFQPLLAFLLVPVHWLVDDLDLVARIDLALLLVIDTATILLLAWIGYRIAGRAAAIVAAALWALSPLAVAMAMGGLETSLAVFMAAAVTAVWIRVAAAPTRSGWVVVGIVAGLAVLARLDLLLLVALIALWQLWRGPRRALGPAAIGGVVVVAPWWIYCTVQFGSPIPTSGRAEHFLASLEPFGSHSFAQVAGVVAGGPFDTLRGFRESLDRHPGVGVVLYAAIVVLLVALAWCWATRVPGPAAVVAALPGYAIGLMFFYAWFGVGWYYVRYLAPVAMVATLALAFGAAHLWAMDHRARVWALGCVALVAVIPVTVAVRGQSHNLTASRPYTTKLDSATGYRDMALAVRDHVPAGDAVAAWQSGALAYYLDDHATVVNLDGVVDPDAAVAIRNGRTAEYMRHRGVDWLTDVELRVVGFQFGEAARLDPAPTIAADRSVPQFPTFPRYALVHIDW